MATAEVPVGRATGRDMTVDDTQAERSGRWDHYVPDAYTGPSALRDTVLRGTTMPARARFHAALPQSGRYRLCLGYRPASAQASALAVTIQHAGKPTRVKVDQRTGTTPFPFTPLGEYRFSSEGDSSLEISNASADGLVVIDAVRWVWLGD
jgi:hypothetical protein